MTDSDPGTTPSSQRNWGSFLQRIAFLDTSPEGPGSPPIHVAQSLLLDGVEHPELLDPRYGWQVFTTGTSETRVSFVANAEYVEMGTDHRALCGIPVLCPRQEDAPWEYVSEDEIRAVEADWRRYVNRSDLDEDPLYEVRGYRLYPYARVQEPPKLIRVCVQVREVLIVAAQPKAGDRVTDGGFVGTLVKCEQCSGDGLLHQPDPDQMPSAQEPSA
jgi:hypothetical protein